MSTTKQPLAVLRTALTSSSLATLASATYCVSSAYTPNTNQPVDVVVEVAVATTNATSGNKQVKVFVKISTDGTNYTSGPETGTTVTSEGALYYLGFVPLPTSSQTESKAFSIFNAVGFVPYAFKVVIFDDLGAALTSGAIYTTEVTSTST